MDKDKELDKVITKNRTNCPIILSPPLENKMHKIHGVSLM
jgi:hypothetical protein